MKFFHLIFYVFIFIPYAQLYSQQKISEPLVLQKKGLELFKKGNEKCARIIFKDITDDYPDTDEAKFAKKWLQLHPFINQKWHTAFILSSTLFVMDISALYSMGTALYLDENNKDSESMIKALPFIVVGTGLATLATTYYMTKNKEITESQTNMFGFMNSWGYINGWLLADIIFDPVKIHHYLYGAAIGQTLGFASALALWKHLDISKGSAAFSGFFSHELALLLLQLNFAIGGADVFDKYEKLSILSLIIPMDAGAVAGYYLSKKLKWSSSRIGYITLSGLMGELLGVGTIGLIKHDSFKTDMWILATSQIIGIGAGILITMGMSNDESDGAKNKNALLNINNKGQLSVGLPSPTITPSPFFAQKKELFYTINLMSGAL